MSTVNEMHKILTCLTAYFFPQNTELIATMCVLRLIIVLIGTACSLSYMMLKSNLSTTTHANDTKNLHIT
jgi:hypothetical protein